MLLSSLNNFDIFCFILINCLGAWKLYDLAGAFGVKVEAWIDRRDLKFIPTCKHGTSSEESCPWCDFDDI